jgi:hypothetical protein
MLSLSLDRTVVLLARRSDAESAAMPASSLCQVLESTPKPPSCPGSDSVVLTGHPSHTGLETAEYGYGRRLRAVLKRGAEPVLSN